LEETEESDQRIHRGAQTGNDFATESVFGAISEGSVACLSAAAVAVGGSASAGMLQFLVRPRETVAPEAAAKSSVALATVLVASPLTVRTKSPTCGVAELAAESAVMATFPEAVVPRCTPYNDPSAPALATGWIRPSTGGVGASRQDEIVEANKTRAQACKSTGGSA
jgi:hypothetical protein